MILTFEDVLSVEELARLHAIAAATTFVDGRESASADLASTKQNEQMSSVDPSMNEIAQIVGLALQRHASFASATLPRRMHSLRLARYRQGMRYGRHIDAAIMRDGGSSVRADLSFTLFLDDPESYEGGELHIGTDATARAFKLPARALVCYATGSLHEVREVTRGERRAVVGWIESFVHDAEDREVLYDLARVMACLPEGANDARELLVKTHTNLLRRWAVT
jgi:PKHD-type hydroxylase